MMCANITYCNIDCLATSKRAIPEKIQKRGVEDILFWKSPGYFNLFTLPLENPHKTKLNPWKFQGQKQRP